MGLYLSQYIGPVLLAKQKRGEKATTYRACSGTSCDLYRKEGKVHGKHCHQCGSEIKSYKGKPRKVDKPDSDEVWNALASARLNEEALCINHFIEPPQGYTGYVAYFPNNYLGTEPPRNFRPDNPEKSSVLLHDVNPGFDIAWFQKTYAKHIETFRTLYDDVEVVWGVFTYQS